MLWGSFWNCKLFSVATLATVEGRFEPLQLQNYLKYYTTRTEKKNNNNKSNGNNIILTHNILYCVPTNNGRAVTPTMDNICSPDSGLPSLPSSLALSLSILSWLNSENIIFALSIVFFILLFHWSRTNLVKNKSRRGFSPVLKSQVIADKLRIYKMLANIFRLDKGRAKVLRQALLSRKLFAHNFWLGLN